MSGLFPFALNFAGTMPHSTYGVNDDGPNANRLPQVRVKHNREHRKCRVLSARWRQREVPAVLILLRLQMRVRAFVGSRGEGNGRAFKMTTEEYAAGVKAAELGMTAADCPFPTGTKRRDWLAGFFSVKKPPQPSSVYYYAKKKPR